MNISWNRTAQENIVFPKAVLNATYATRGTDGIRSFRQCIFDLIES
jgi:hypothetical protein